MEKEFISERKAAEIAGVQHTTLYNYRHKGLIPEEIYTVKNYLKAKRVNYRADLLLLFLKENNIIE